MTMTAPAAAVATSASEIQLATFWLGDFLLGIDIHCIRGINRVGTITPVPEAPAMVAGVVNLRGDVVTVVDLRTILHLPAIELTPKTRLLVVQSEAESIGLLVDRVADVVTVTTDDAEPLPANFNGVASQYFTRVYRVGADLLVTLDVTAALAVAEN
ncbi:MAG TPA: chemotaxis protein CheW [Planctomycetaceae bacterium]|nr:chemotaxis protein CheW [Planctomycetaceae bacterium]